MSSLFVLWQCVPCIPAWCFWPAAKHAYWSIILQWGLIDLDLILVLIDFNLFQKQTKKVYIQLPTKECHVINFNINREVKKRLIFSAAGFITCLLMDWHHTSKISWPNRLKIPSIILICNIFAMQFSCESLKNNLYKPI